MGALNNRPFLLCESETGEGASMNAGDEAQHPAATVARVRRRCWGMLWLRAIAKAIAIGLLEHRHAARTGC